MRALHMLVLAWKSLLIYRAARDIGKTLAATWSGIDEDDDEDGVDVIAAFDTSQEKVAAKGVCLQIYRPRSNMRGS